MGSKGVIVEIGTQEVRGMLFSSSLGSIKVERVEAFHIEEGKTSYAMEKLLSAFPSDAPVTLILPGNLFIVRKASLPFTDREKIRKALPYQLDGLLPFPVDELFVDSVLSVPSAKGSDVIAMAIPKKMVADCLALFPAGRKPSKVIPDFISLLSLGKGLRGEGGTCGIIEIRDGNVSMVFLSGGRPVLTRSILSGGDISEEIISTIKHIQAEGQQGETIYVSGSGAQNAAPSLRQATDTLPLPAAVKGISPGDWPSWATLAGGAMAASEYSGFNILGLDAEGERFEKLLKTSAVGAAILLLFGTADIYMHYNTAYTRYSSLKIESNKIFLSVMPHVKKVVKEEAQIKDALNKEKGFREALIGKPSPSYLAVLKGVEDITDKHSEIKIKEAVFEGDKLTISGNGNSIEADGIKKLFSGIEGAKGAQVEEMVQGVEPNSYRFRVKIELKL